jgi:hypothetical protein
MCDSRTSILYSIREYRRVTGLVQILLAVPADEGRQPRLFRGTDGGVPAQPQDARSSSGVYVEMGVQLQYRCPADHLFRFPRRRLCHAGNARHLHSAGSRLRNIHCMRRLRDVYHGLRVLLSRPPRLLARLARRGRLGAAGHVGGGRLPTCPGQRPADCREGNAMPSRRILRYRVLRPIPSLEATRLMLPW